MSRTNPVKTNFFTSPFFLSITVGVPFCIYKILFGILAIRVGGRSQEVLLTSFGVMVILWASADLFLNIIRALYDVAGKISFSEFCTLAQLGRICKASTVFLALDTLLTFIIICFILWSGWVMHFIGYESYLWYFATTLNLISLSLVGLWTELIRLKGQNITDDGYNGNK